MTIPFNNMFFAQNVMPAPLPEPPDPDPGDPDLSGCAIDTEVHPRWNYGGQKHYGVDWFGFKALPGGIRRIVGSYVELGIRAGFWTSTSSSFTVSCDRRLSSYDSKIRRNDDAHKRTGFSLRCVRDVTSGEESDPDGTVYIDDYTDGSGNKYNGVKIGDQIWTKKNLITTKYQNGDDIATGLSSEQWSQTTSGAYAIYPHANVDGINSPEEMVDAYGKLYNWYAVDNGLVTGSYRVSSDDDWTTLTDYLIDEYDLHESNVAMVLKSCRQVNHPLA